MKYLDAVYGEYIIEEPVILDLIECAAIQRLKKIIQAGYPEPFFKIKKISRFEHSLGVYLLLKKYQASLEEQVAGLIHDVSHAVFSHCIDYVLNAGSQMEHSHQDNIFEDFIKKSAIPKILDKHGLDLKFILNDENFKLKEKKLPDLCADRLDYSLRDGLASGKITVGDIQKILTKLKAIDGDWVFDDAVTAKNYAELFNKLNNENYAGLSSAIMHRSVGDYLKHALKMNYINELDLYETEDFVLEKISLRHQTDSLLRKLWRRMNNQILVKNDPSDYESQVFCKSRAVDPLLKNKETTARLSAIDEDWQKTLNLELAPKIYYLKFID